MHPLLRVLFWHHTNMLLFSPVLNGRHLILTQSPISNLSFLSKLLEKCFTFQLVHYLDSNSLMFPLYSNSSDWCLSDHWPVTLLALYACLWLPLTQLTILYFSSDYPCLLASQTGPILFFMIVTEQIPTFRLNIRMVFSSSHTPCSIQSHQALFLLLCYMWPALAKAGFWEKINFADF